jgi:hypothetical protein
VSGKELNNGWLSMKGCKIIQTMPTVKDCDLARAIKFKNTPKKQEIICKYVVRISLLQTSLTKHHNDQ